jgi:hypothetical protein
MKEWAVRHTIGIEDTELILNQFEEDGWSVFYVGYSSDTCRFITWFSKEKEQCKILDTPLLPEPKRS